MSCVARWSTAATARATAATSRSHSTLRHLRPACPATALRMRTGEAFDNVLTFCSGLLPTAANERAAHIRRPMGGVVTVSAAMGTRRTAPDQNEMRLAGKAMTWAENSIRARRRRRRRYWPLGSEERCRPVPLARFQTGGRRAAEVQECASGRQTSRRPLLI